MHGRAKVLPALWRRELSIPRLGPPPGKGGRDIATMGRGIGRFRALCHALLEAHPVHLAPHGAGGRSLVIPRVVLVLDEDPEPDSEAEEQHDDRGRLPPFDRSRTPSADDCHTSIIVPGAGRHNPVGAKTT